MAVTTTGAGDVELLLADGTTWLPLMLAPRLDERGNPLPKTLEAQLAASDKDLPFADELVPKIQESWFRGVGLDYDWAPGCDPTDPEYVCPAGEAADVTIPAGGSGGIAAIVEFDSHLWFLQGGDGTAGNTRVLVALGGVPPLTVSPLSIIAGQYGRGMCVGDDGGGNSRLYVTTSDGGTQNGMLHEWNGSTWRSTAAPPGAGSFGTNGRGPIRKVTWRGRDGIKNNTMVTKSGPRKISYVRPGGDPMTAGGWIEGIPIGTGYEIIDLATSRGHVFFSARDNLFDIDEVGNTPGLTSFLEDIPRIGNGDAVLYLDGYIYYSTGDGMLMIKVDGQSVVQEIPGYCAPGAYHDTIACPRGPVTALCPDQSWVVASVFDTASTRSSNIFYGKPASTVGVESANPMIWHGPLLRIEGNYRVTRMHMSALSGLRLWVGSILDQAPSTPRISYLSRPSSGSTLWDQTTGGTHRVTTGLAGGTLQPYSRLFGLRDSWGDKGSRKDLHEHVVGSVGLSAIRAGDGTTTDDGVGTKMIFYTRADATPGSAAWGNPTDVTTTPTQAITASSPVVGHTTEYRVEFYAPQGGATPPKIPYLDSIRSTAWLIQPQTDVLTLAVTYGDGVQDLYHAHDEVREPDWITAQLQALVGNRTTIRDRQGTRWNVRLHQLLPRAETLAGHVYGKRVAASLRMIVLGRSPSTTPG